MKNIENWRVYFRCSLLSKIKDVLIFGDSEPKHDQRLIQLFRQLSESGVTINKKRKLSQRGTDVTFLWHVIEEEKMNPDPRDVRLRRILTAIGSKTRKAGEEPAPAYLP